MVILHVAVLISVTITNTPLNITIHIIVSIIICIIISIGVLSNGNRVVEGMSEMRKEMLRLE